MPIYEYNCAGCQHAWDEILGIDQRDDPVDQECPECKTVGKVARATVYSTSMNSDTTMTPDKATGGQWGELMSRMKKGAGVRKADADRLDRASSRTGRRWKG
jgi:putative FmdB family regulatory protein